MAILAGFSFNKRVLIQGYHGTGKSTHIEQVAARLNWPCVRVNLDSHISRIDLIGKDAIVLKENKQITEFKEGILPWSIQNPVALVFDEYDAGRPDVMFVIQRVLESNGNFTLLDKNKVLEQHDFFRLFATSNTIGLGDTSGLYHGTQQINQGQMDRWNIVSTLNYLSFEKELEIILAIRRVCQGTGSSCTRDPKVCRTRCCSCRRCPKGSYKAASKEARGAKPKVGLIKKICKKYRGKLLNYILYIYYINNVERLGSKKSLLYANKYINIINLKCVYADNSEIIKHCPQEIENCTTVPQSFTPYL